jgi:hypothetical protein
MTVTTPADAAVPAPIDLLRRLAAAASREQALFVLGTGTVALHVVDDNFLQPEPGTSAGDHLLSGLLPLAVLTGVAAAYPRLRPGLRAALALAFGVLAVVGGVEAAYYASNGGASGDDYTGFLSMAAGLLLLGTGLVTLWRSRRTGDSLPRRYARRILRGFAAVAVAAFVLFPISLAYVVTHTARAGVPAAELGAPYEDVELTTSDGLRLRGWYIPSKNRAAVIVFPGRSGTQKQARLLVRHGYGVLLFDRRGEGASDGDPNIFGWHGERDLHAGAEFLQRRSDIDPERIGGIGLSVGGEMLIHAAAHSDAFRAIVSEGASGQSLRDELANPGLSGRLLDLPTQVTLTAALTVFGNALPPPSLKGEVAKIAPSSVFLVYGENGQGGSEARPNAGFYAAARRPKQLWEVPGAQHIAGITTAPAEYERRVVGFFDTALLR